MKFNKLSNLFGRKEENKTVKRVYQISSYFDPQKKLFNIRIVPRINVDRSIQEKLRSMGRRIYFRGFPQCHYFNHTLIEESEFNDDTLIKAILQITEKKDERKYEFDVAYDPNMKILYVRFVNYHLYLPEHVYSKGIQRKYGVSLKFVRQLPQEFPVYRITREISESFSTGLMKYLITDGKIKV